MHGIPLSPDLFVDRTPSLNKAFSVKLYGVFREIKGFINQNGYLKNDGPQIQWKEALIVRNPISEYYEYCLNILVKCCIMHYMN